MYSSEDPTHEFSPDYAQDGLRILISNPLMSTHTHTLNFSYSVCAIGEMLLVGWVALLVNVSVLWRWNYDFFAVH